IQPADPPVVGAEPIDPARIFLHRENVGAPQSYLHRVGLDRLSRFPSDLHDPFGGADPDRRSVGEKGPDIASLSGAEAPRKVIIAGRSSGEDGMRRVFGGGSIRPADP